MAEFISLYSGSSGNCSVVRCGQRYLIVDMGKGVRRVFDKLNKTRRSPQGAGAEHLRLRRHSCHP